jgi:nicotinamide mononucleotide (NMN) deamidase PncC
VPTGYAGPPAGDETEPVGTAYIGLATPGGAGSHKVQWFGTRQEVQNRTSKSALDVLRRFFRAP